MNAVAAASSEWPYGRVRVRAVDRIGIGYGLAGAVYCIEAEADCGWLSFVVKHEDAEAVESALRFHRAIGTSLEGSIPTLLGGAVDNERQSGVLLLEDISPAEQGDALRPCTDPQAAAAVRSLARVHAATWNRDGMPPWRPHVLSPGEWATRLDAASGRFPGIVTPALRAELRGLPDRAREAVDALAAGDTAWIHGDAHLDNVLFRADGTAVLLDWSGVVVGPPAIDLARLLTEGVNAGARRELADRLVAAYMEELASRGATLETDDLRLALASALVLLTQTAVAWAARDVDREPADRVRALQENLLRSALSWASNGA